MAETRSTIELASSYHASLYRWALALSRRDRQEAMEIVQQTYVEVLEGRANLDSARDPRAFLFGVARRVAASRNRRNSILGRILGGAEKNTQILTPVPSPEDEVAVSERVSAVREALKRLPKRQLQVVTLVFMEGLTVEEAAEAMDISVGSARTHYHRAKERVRKIMEEDHAGPGQQAQQPA
jgi:RNA polymerase sigma-70 factor, ECF subfamily